MKKLLTGLIMTLSILSLLVTGCGSSAGKTGPEASSTENAADISSGENYDGKLHVENGMMQPMLEYTSMRGDNYSNKGSDILRFCVYIETDYDTDGDGKADLVKALVQLPRAAAEGNYKAGVIYDPTPYSAGIVTDNSDGSQKIYTKKEFDYKKLYKKGEKREAAGQASTLKTAAEANPKDWNYTVPNDPNQLSYRYGEMYDYYLIRGFAVVSASGIGTYGSEGFELCGMDLERDSHKAVVEWLTGDRPAYTDPENNIEIKADWSNGKVAMTGVSYGGTMPFEVATTGVKGLETIIPIAGIASWYDYTNAQGVSTISDVHYADWLAGWVCGGTFLDNDWTVPNEEYGSWLYQIAQDQDKTNGDYAPVWESSDYSKDYKDIKCSALIVQGMNDYNVTTKQADLMAQAFEAAGKPYKVVLHQDGHSILDGMMVNGVLWEETINRWLSHYLYDVDNGIEDMAQVTVQSNTDGSYTTYDSWRDFKYSDLKVSYDKEETEVSSHGLAKSTNDFLTSHGSDLNYVEYRDELYLNLDETNASSYVIDMPENGTIYGVPEIHVKLKTDYTNLDGLMISAVLVDTMENGEPFKAYVLKDKLHQRLPKKTVSHYDFGGGVTGKDLIEFVQSSTVGKCISYGWTDLRNPGLGYDSSEYSKATNLEAGKYYDYTFYMLPTVYTVQKGHKLKLILMTWDPFRAFLDEDFTIDKEDPGEVSKYDYSYTIDNKAINVRMPLADQ